MPAYRSRPGLVSCPVKHCGGKIVLHNRDAAPAWAGLGDSGLESACYLCGYRPGQSRPATPADSARAARDAFVARRQHHRSALNADRTAQEPRKPRMALFDPSYAVNGVLIDPKSLKRRPPYGGHDD